MLFVFRLGHCAGLLMWAGPELFSASRSDKPGGEQADVDPAQVTLAEGGEPRSLLIQFKVSKARIVDSGLPLLGSHFIKLIEVKGNGDFADVMY